MSTPARAPHNRGPFKNVAKAVREYFYPRSAKQRAYVMPFNNTRTRKNNNKSGGGLFTFLGTKRSTVSPNNGNKNTTRNAKQRRESCLNKCKSSYNNSESKSASILKKYLNCCKHCRESTRNANSNTSVGNISE